MHWVKSASENSKHPEKSFVVAAYEKKYQSMFRLLVIPQLV